MRLTDCPCSPLILLIRPAVLKDVLRASAHELEVVIQHRPLLASTPLRIPAIPDLRIHHPNLSFIIILELPILIHHWIHLKPVITTLQGAPFALVIGKLLVERADYVSPLHALVFAEVLDEVHFLGGVFLVRVSLLRLLLQTVEGSMLILGVILVLSLL